MPPREFLVRPPSGRGIKRDLLKQADDLLLSMFNGEVLIESSKMGPIWFPEYSAYKVIVYNHAYYDRARTLLETLGFELGM